VHFDRLFEFHENTEDAIEQFTLDLKKAKEQPDREREDS
jgi:uncharacterized protein YdcH (DUF465 family)